MVKGGSKIKPVFVDDLSDGRAHQEINGQALADPRADFGGGNAEGKPAQAASLEWRWERGFGLTGARDDDESGELGEFVGVAPLGQQRGVIGADEVMECCAGVTPGVVANGEYGIGDAAAAKFLIVDGALRLAGEGEAKQAEPVFG
jgi:hypothetical protein